MFGHYETKACTNCAKSRRRCGKQHPACLRCQTRHLSCEYPPTRRTSFVPLLEHGSQSTSGAGTGFAFPSPLDFCLPLIDTQSASSWFSSPMTWNIDPPPQSPASITSRCCLSEFTHGLQRVFQWLNEWVETGSCPFIHHRLYRTHLPSAIQSAFTALSAYNHKTRANEEMVLKIIEGHATRLVADGLLAFATGSSTVAVDALDNLSRVQALLIYQCIGLYDGNLRLRRVTEDNIPVLEDWIGIVMHQTSQTLCYCSSDALLAQNSAHDFMPSPDDLWLSWVLAESVRRLWLITAGLQGLYKLFRSPSTTTSCMGSTVFTSRRGFWEAPSAAAWGKRCAERYAGLIRLTETDKLLSMVPRGELSDFTRLVLQCAFGLDWCEMVGV